MISWPGENLAARPCGGIVRRLHETLFRSMSRRAALALAIVLACEEKPPAPPAPVRPAPTPAPPPPGRLRARDDLLPEHRALLVIGEEERIVDAREAEAEGYTIVDLSDDWVPFIFAEHSDEAGRPLHNRYRRVFIGLANDRLDDDGQPIEPGRTNYLELFGIPPSLGVLRQRFLEDADKTCDREIDAAALAGVETLTHYAADAQARRENKRGWIPKELADPKLKLTPSQIDYRNRWIANYDAELRAIAEVEKRLACEGLLAPKPGAKPGAKGGHKQGTYDEAMVVAVRAFQHKNKIYESNYRLRRTLDTLVRPLLANDHDALVRVLTERVADAAAILEDGSVKDGKNLVDEYARAALSQLGVATPDSALAFFRRRPAQDFRWLRAAVRLPPRPDHYAAHMDLRIVIDAGDVWYEPLFDAKGNLKNPSRDRFPSFTVSTAAGGKRLPLVRWRTTVGGWRSEQARDGYEYFRYKGSDLGPRVMRRVVSGPVWVAPESTPIRSLVKRKYVDRALQPVVDYDEIGPGYRSAYGLVAGYFVVPGTGGRPDWDKGIRAHGSSEYLSIYSNGGYSHGCHRLPNHLAIRLYSFILRHRTMKPLGDEPMSFSRQFLRDEDVFELRIPSRGFAYLLDPPIDVEVLEGTVRGKEEKPVTVYVAKPGVVYPGPPPPVPDSAEARAGGGPGGVDPPPQEQP
jgi:hypothetical protein